MGKFDSLTRSLAGGGLSRRESLKLAMASAGAAVLSAVGVAGAAADNSPSTEVLCGSCRGVAEYSNCSGCGNGNCYCFSLNTSSRLKCGCNIYCSNSVACSTNTDCGRGQFCSANSCGSVCLPKCKAGSTCTLTPAKAGSATAIGA